MDPLLWLWKNGSEFWGQKWLRDWGAVPSETLRKTLSKLTVNEIKSGLAQCLNAGGEWPPSPAAFISICKSAGLDVDGSYKRFLDGLPPKDLAERITRAEIAYNCKRAAQDKAQKLWALHYGQNYKKMLSGALQEPKQRMLPKHVQAKATDTMRDNFKPKTERGREIMERVSKIFGGEDV